MSTHTAQGQGTFKGAGGFVINPSLVKAAAAANLPGSGGVTVVANDLAAAGEVLQGTGGFTAIGVELIHDTGTSLNGIGSLTALASPPEQFEAVNLAATGSFTINPASVLASALSALSATGSFGDSGQAVLLAAAKALLQGAGGVTAGTLTPQQFGVVTLSAMGGLAPTATEIQQALSSLGAAGGLTSGATELQQEFSLLSAAGILTAGQVTALISAQETLSGVGTLTVSGTVVTGAQQGQSVFIAATTFTATAAGSVGQQAFVQLMAQGELTINAEIVLQPAIIPNGRWEAVVDTSFNPTMQPIVEVTPALVPYKGEQGFTMFFLSPTATEFNHAVELMFVKPSGQIVAVGNERLYAGTNPQFFIYIVQGTYAAFVSKSSDFDEAGVWQVYLSENGVPTSGRGYFSVVNA